MYYARNEQGIRISGRRGSSDGRSVGRDIDEGKAPHFIMLSIVHRELACHTQMPPAQLGLRRAVNNKYHIWFIATLKKTELGSSVPKQSVQVFLAAIRLSAIVSW